jgi:hypothetical protein
MYEDQLKRLGVVEIEDVKLLEETDFAVCGFHFPI